ncbi:hypothetical protein PR048_005726, partial [Dryococelus australis]
MYFNRFAARGADNVDGFHNHWTLATSISGSYSAGFLSVCGREGGYKSLIYANPVDTEENLVVHVAAAAMIISETPGIFKRTRKSQVRRCQLCVEVSGEKFQLSNVFKCTNQPSFRENGTWYVDLGPTVTAK